MDIQVRPFDWRDLPKLHRNRQRSIILNISLYLTRGPQLIPGALLSYIAPAMGVYTCIGSADENASHTIIAQAIHHSGSQFSHMTFITPDSALGSPALNNALEYLIKETGQRGAYHLLADVDEYHPAYSFMRKASFATYSRQRVWQLDAKKKTSSPQPSWKAASGLDSLDIRSLYHNLVPAMVQQVEPFSIKEPQGVVLRQEGELMAYVELKYGHRGIWVQPLVHPDILDIAQALNNLVCYIPYRRNRPVYFCIRSYHFWLENALEEQDATPGTTQALMVKHLTVPKKAALSYERPVIEGGRPEVTASISNSENKS